MNDSRRTLLKTGLGIGLVASTLGTTWAQSWPDRPIRLVVPFAPGGATDIVGRLVARHLGENLGQPIMVENRAGAGGIIGTTAVAQAAADGNVLLLGTAETFGIAESLMPKLAFNSADFAPLALITRIPSVFVVHPSVPAQSMTEFISYVKANPGKVSFASPGKGTNVHLIGEMFKSRFGLDMVHVPYKGGAPAVTDLLAGQVQMMPAAVASIASRIKSGHVRALAITSEKRSPLLPDVPTMAEAGVADFVVGGWFGVLVRKNTPAPIARRLETELQAIGNLPAFKQQLIVAGGDGDVIVGPAFARFIETQTMGWRRVVSAANIKAE